MLRSHPPRGRMSRPDHRRLPVVGRPLAAVAALVVLGAVALPTLAGPSPQRTVRVRVAAKGRPDISADGRLVAFSSTAGNLADGLPAGQRNVYVRDLDATKTVLVSATPDGGPPDGDSSAPAISPDGRYVSFATTATNLVP